MRQIIENYLSLCATNVYKWYNNELYTNDGSRPTENAIQVEFSNHSKVLYSKTMVLSIREKPGIKSKKVVSYLPERTYLDKSMKVSQILTFFEEFYDDFSKEKVINLLKDLDLDINSKVSKMSKRMQEKLQ